MNWLRKIAQSEEYELFGDVNDWKDGQLALIFSHGLGHFSVVEILSWDDVAILDEEYKNDDMNTISTERGFGYKWKRKDSVPMRVIKTYSGMGKSPLYDPGTIHLIGPQNIFRTYTDFIKKESKSMYQDLALKFLCNPPPHVLEFMKDYPELIGQNTDIVDYQTFEISGHEVQIINDKNAARINPGILQTRGTEGIFYWYIPDLDTRSMDHKEGIDQFPWGSGRYPTMKRALESAEKYINFLFYGEDK